MKYLPCSLLPSRFHTWDFREQQEHLIFNIWSLMRLEAGSSPLLIICYVSWSVISTLFWQFVSPTRCSHIYSEKLVHLPHCYFVNDYKQVSMCTFEPVPSQFWCDGALKSFTLVIRKIGMYWIQVANPGVQITDLQRTSLYLPVSISCTRWTLKYFRLGKCMDRFYNCLLCVTVLSPSHLIISGAVYLGVYRIVHFGFSDFQLRVKWGFGHVCNVQSAILRYSNMWWTFLPCFKTVF